MISFELSGSCGDWPLRVGIYAIRHVATSHCYVGRAAGLGGLKKRLREHRRLLRRKEHGNRHLQSAYVKYGEAAFQIDILEFCKHEEAPAREAYWCDYIGAHFNIEPVDVGGTQRHSPEVQAKIIRANSKPFALKAPDGTIYRGANLKQFCREHGLAQSVMSLIVRGKGGHRHHKGWTREDWTLTPAELAVAKPKNFTLVSPAGAAVRGSNITAFAKQHGIAPSNLNLVLSGTLLSAKGWRLPGTRRHTRCRVSAVLMGPDGERVEIANVSLFSRERGLCDRGIRMVISGDRPHYAGWRLPD